MAINKITFYIYQEWWLQKVVENENMFHYSTLLEMIHGLKHIIHIHVHTPCVTKNNIIST
jgi:hypothetical protein